MYKCLDTKSSTNAYLIITLFFTTRKRIIKLFHKTPSRTLKIVFSSKHSAYFDKPELGDFHLILKLLKNIHIIIWLGHFSKRSKFKSL